MDKQKGKITLDVVDLINERYAECHNYSQVAREIGCSPSTVKRYVKVDYIQKKDRAPAVVFEANELPDFAEKHCVPFAVHSNNWGEILELSEQERKEMRGEFYYG